jgi:serine/threonine-protein kinase HipA
MGRRSHAQRLNIWLNGLPVGCWETAAGRHTLTYFDEWRNDEQTRPLSLSLPFKPGNAAHTGPAVRDFFDNLLPDSDAIRRRIASHFGTDGIEQARADAAWMIRRASASAYRRSRR